MDLLAFGGVANVSAILTYYRVRSVCGDNRALPKYKISHFLEAP
jgi:hypothetical protein